VHIIESDLEQQPCDRKPLHNKIAAEFPLPAVCQAGQIFKLMLGC
jgi:hypothetical protein